MFDCLFWNGFKWKEGEKKAEENNMTRREIVSLIIYVRGNVADVMMSMLKYLQNEILRVLETVLWQRIQFEGLGDALRLEMVHI